MSTTAGTTCPGSSRFIFAPGNLKDPKMNVIFSKRFFLRLSALLLMVGLVVLDCLVEKDLPAISFILCCLVAGCALLIMVPSLSEEFNTGKWIIVCSEASFAVIYCIARENDLSSCSFAILAIIPFILAGFFTCRSVMKFRLVRSLFQADATWVAVEEYSRFFYALVLLSIALLSCLALEMPSGPVSFVAVMILCGCASGLFVILWIRSYSGHTMLISKRKEALVKETISGKANMSLPESAEEQARMNSTYKRLLAYMEAERPYLKDAYYITDLCSDLGVNKVYISNVINVFSGRNFRQFINYYRIRHAVGIMKENPSLLIMELALMSGFHSVVSFNMAFKLFMKCTPSEYLAKVRGGEVPSSPAVEGR